MGDGEKKSNFGKSFLDFIDKSVEAGKRSFVSASAAVADFGDKSVQRIELSQFKTKKNKLLTDLGETIYKTYKESDTQNLPDEAIKLISELEKIEAEIKNHEDSLKEAEEKKTRAREERKAEKAAAKSESSGSSGEIVVEISDADDESETKETESGQSEKDS